MCHITKRTTKMVLAGWQIKRSWPFTWKFVECTWHSWKIIANKGSLVQPLTDGRTDKTSWEDMYWPGRLAPSSLLHHMSCFASLKLHYITWLLCSNVCSVLHKHYGLRFDMIKWISVDVKSTRHPLNLHKSNATSLALHQMTRTIQLQLNHCLWWINYRDYSIQTSKLIVDVIVIII